MKKICYNLGKQQKEITPQIYTFHLYSYRTHYLFSLNVDRVFIFSYTPTMVYTVQY